MKNVHRGLAEAQARFQEELQRRDQMRVQEAQRLQAALQERSRQLRVVELELQRIRPGNVARAVSVPGSAADDATGRGPGTLD